MQTSKYAPRIEAQIHETGRFGPLTPGQARILLQNLTPDTFCLSECQRYIQLEASTSWAASAPIEDHRSHVDIPILTAVQPGFGFWLPIPRKTLSDRLRRPSLQLGHTYRVRAEKRKGVEGAIAIRIS